MGRLLKVPGYGRAADSSTATVRFARSKLHLARKTALFLIALLGLAAPAQAHTLPYAKARAIAQQKSNEFAGQPTRLMRVEREFGIVVQHSERHRWTSEAKWHRVWPNGCLGCRYDPDAGVWYDQPDTETCTVTFQIRFAGRRSTRIVTEMLGYSCY